MKAARHSSCTGGLARLGARAPATAVPRYLGDINRPDIIADQLRADILPGQQQTHLELAPGCKIRLQWPGMSAETKSLREILVFTDEDDEPLAAAST